MKKNQGFTLIEVLVAILVLGVGLLGLASLQSVTIRNTESANLRSQASQLSSNLIDRIKANPFGALGGGYIVDEAPGAGGDCSSGCNFAGMAEADLDNWYTRVERILGNVVVSTDAAVDSVATITCASHTGVAGGGGTPCPQNSMYTITLFWAERVSIREDADSGGTNDGFKTKSYVTQFQL